MFDLQFNNRVCHLSVLATLSAKWDFIIGNVVVKYRQWFQKIKSESLKKCIFKR